MTNGNESFLMDFKGLFPLMQTAWQRATQSILLDDPFQGFGKRQQATATPWFIHTTSLH